MKSRIQAFITGYIACALWASPGDDERENLDDFDQFDITAKSHSRIKDHCLAFIEANFELLDEVCLIIDNDHDGRYSWSRAGHDLYLTENGHGAGFWDRGLGEIGEKLSQSARYKETFLYVGDDGLLHYSI